MCDKTIKINNNLPSSCHAHQHLHPRISQHLTLTSVIVVLLHHPCVALNKHTQTKATKIDRTAAALHGQLQYTYIHASNMFHDINFLLRPKYWRMIPWGRVSQQFHRLDCYSLHGQLTFRCWLEGRCFGQVVVVVNNRLGWRRVARDVDYRVLGKCATGSGCTREESEKELERDNKNERRWWLIEFPKLAMKSLSNLSGSNICLPLGLWAFRDVRLESKNRCHFWWLLWICFCTG